LTTIKSEQTFFTKKLRELNIAHANGARRAHQRSEHSWSRFSPARTFHIRPLAGL